MRKLVIRGARQHNLGNIDLELPHGKMIAVTGVSGSGKSSLAFDTIFAEGQRRYIESLSSYARQFIEKLGRPDLDSIEGISPTIAIRQKNTVTSARSTVGTATEIYDYLRLLYARVGRIHCPRCGVEVRSWAPTEVAREAVEVFSGRRIYLLMPVEVDGDWDTRKGYLRARGYTRVYAGGETLGIEEFEPGNGKMDTVDILVDRVRVSASSRTRIAEAVETAYSEHEGMVDILDPESGERRRFSLAPSCGACGRVFEEPTPLLFSFNSPYGACPDCRGFGDRMEFSEEMIVPDGGLSLRQRAVDPWARERFEYYHSKLMAFCAAKRIPVDVPWRDLPEETRSLILEGEGNYPGVIPFLERMKEKSYRKGHRFFTRRYMGYTRCRSCGGSRLREEARFVLVGGRSISDISAMTPAAILEALRGAGFDAREKEIAGDILAELESRLSFLTDVGLGYLTLDRLTRTLSGGEAQRINLANSLGANLVDTLYVLDEPSVGLHAADNRRLIDVLRRLRDLGNTVLVVEHDPDIIRAADHLIDLGPGPGRDGGRVLYNGPVSRASGKNPGLRIPIEKERREDFLKEVEAARLNPRGRGSLREQIERAFKDFPEGKDTKLLVVLCDGADTGGASFCEKALETTRPEGLRFYVISLNLEDPAEQVELNCLSSQMDGKSIHLTKMDNLTSTLLPIAQRAYKDEDKRKRRVAEEQKRIEELLSKTRLKVEEQTKLSLWLANVCSHLHFDVVFGPGIHRYDG